MVTITLSDTGTAKLNLVEMAFEECGSAGFMFERTPEEVASALRKLNALMAEWPWSLVGFVQPGYGVGLVTDFSGIPDSTVQAAALELALRIAPQMGKALQPETRAAHARSLSLLRAEYASVPTAQMPGGLHRGSGSRIAYTPLIET